MGMKVIEHIKDNRTGEVRQVSWGNKIESDLSIVSSVTGILQHQRDRENDETHAFIGRMTTVAITIEL